MIHITDVTWAQLALIVVGAMLQLAALSTFARDPSVHTGVQPEGKNPEEEEDHTTEEKTKLPEHPPVVKTYHPRVDHSHDHEIGLSPGQLVKTAKVGFKQHFRDHH